VARTEKKRNAQRVWMGDPLENIYLKELQVDGKIILKEIIRVSVILHLIRSFLTSSASPAVH